MLQQLNLERVLVLDIETVSQQPDFEQLSSEWKSLWEKKAGFLQRGQVEEPAELYSRAGIYAEFGKIVCISVGIFVPHDDHFQLRVKSFYGDNEVQVLQDFAELLQTRFHHHRYALAAHNGKEFDFPYLCRRMLINGVKLPLLLDMAGRKPWEINHLDTLELWKFGDFKHYTSLQLLAAAFGIPTPKDDIDGSQVGSVYWQEKNLERIKIYCQKDVITVAQLLLRFKGLRLLSENQVEYAAG